MATFTGIQFNDVTTVDRQGAKHVVDKENVRRANANPPESLLPAANNAEYESSYVTMLLSAVAKAHDSYIKQAANSKASTDDLLDRFRLATEAEQNACLAELPSLP